MKATRRLVVLVILSLVISACGQITSTPSPTSAQPTVVPTSISTCVAKGTTVVFNQTISDSEKAVIEIRNDGMNENNTIGQLIVTTTVKYADEVVKTSSKAVYVTLTNLSSKFIFDQDLEIAYNRQTDYLLLTWDTNECMSHEFITIRPEMVGSPSTSIPFENTCQEGQIQLEAIQVLETQTLTDLPATVYIKNHGYGKLEVTVISEQANSILQTTKTIIFEPDSNGLAVFDLSSENWIPGEDNSIVVSLNLQWQESCMTVTVPK